MLPYIFYQLELILNILGTIIFVINLHRANYA